ncbi:biopolymer transporter ExbD [Methylophilaceae bacterium]|nr:biopolymer transporter ExbD [Methylophilaceae bacterium]MDA9085650.1 biopolymer transporter ExbD [Methylophilaceae bacterium]MDC0115828.1 biopolymer transporter ExbD [Methylophilaceae bacterium]MDC1114180.1 biopolymer transporter ExbD [Methylophilaceae bacterium]
MRTSRRSRSDDIELNFIPLIDVLLVIIIFLMVTTTFAKLSEIKINLPVAEENTTKEKAVPINIMITEDGRYLINEKLVESVAIEDMANTLREIAQGKKDTPVIISADANARHQSIINMMEASRKAELSKIAFTTKPTK